MACSSPGIFKSSKKLNCSGTCCIVKRIPACTFLVFGFPFWSNVAGQSHLFGSSMSQSQPADHLHSQKPENAEGSDPNWFDSVTIPAARPDKHLRIATLDDLPERWAAAIGTASTLLGNAHSPQTRNHRAAIFLMNIENAGTMNGSLVNPLIAHNMDAAQRAKSCAEWNGLNRADTTYEAYRHLKPHIEFIGTIARREDEHGSGEHGWEPAVSPCGFCREALASHYDHDTGEVTLLRPETPIVLSPSDSIELQIINLQNLMPLRFMKGGFDPEAIEKLAIPSLRIESFSELICEGQSVSVHSAAREYARAENFRHSVEELTGRDFERLQSAAQDAHIHSRAIRSGKQVGAAVLAADGVRVYTGAARETLGANGDMGATRAALNSSQGHGTSVIKALAVHSDDDTDHAGIILPSGEDLQYLFDRAQISAIDFPVILSRKGSDLVVVVPISELLPLGEGPLDSRSTRRNIAHYRKLDGKVI